MKGAAQRCARGSQWGLMALDVGSVSGLRRLEACTETYAKQTKLDLKCTLQKLPDKDKKTDKCAFRIRESFPNIQGNRKAL